MSISHDENGWYLRLGRVHVSLTTHKHFAIRHSMIVRRYNLTIARRLS